MLPRKTKQSAPLHEGDGRSREASDEVLARLARGDMGALEEVFSVYGDRVFSICLGILGNRTDAEDASQEVFLRAFQQASKFSGHSRFSTWLMRLAANQTLNRAKAATRRRRLSEALTMDAVCAGPEPEQAAMVQERRAVVLELLEQLPREQRQVLVLREMEGLSYAELAEVLGIPVGTVTSRLIRGRDRLRALILDSGVCAPGAG